MNALLYLRTHARVRPLAFSLALAFGGAVASPHSDALPGSELDAAIPQWMSPVDKVVFRKQLERLAAHAPPDVPGGSIPVSNCDDSGAGSLRAALNSAVDGDTIDMTALNCSTITLTTGQLDVAVDGLFLHGNGVTVDAAGSSRVLSHAGAGLLGVIGVGLVNGSVEGGSGGCIYSRGSIFLDNVTMRRCTAVGPRQAYGGGVFAAGSIYMTNSTVADSMAIHISGLYYESALGGGLAAMGDIVIVYSTVSGNSVVAGTAYSGGGGFWSGGAAEIASSTISGNYAEVAGGGRIGSGSSSPIQSGITDSTISGNTAAYRTAGIFSNDSILRIENSTIAFNSALSGVGGVGVWTAGWGNFLYLASSIIAENTTADGTPDDFCWQGGNGGGVLGANNIIIASCNGMEPDDTIHADPLLAPLDDNGGPTMTHALLPGSPAIDHGSNASLLATDQRGYPRISGRAADIGALELQQVAPPDEIFRNGFDGARFVWRRDG